MKTNCTKTLLTTAAAAIAVAGVGIVSVAGAAEAPGKMKSNANATLQGVGISTSGPVAIGSSQILTVDVTGIESIAAFGDPANIVQTFNLGANAHVIGIGWDVTLEAFDPSWLSEITVDLTDTDISTGITLSPGAGDDGPGVASYDSGGILNVVDLDLDFSVGADGMLRLEFWDGFVDFPSPQPDGIWVSGTLSVQYVGGAAPCPGDLNNDGVVNVSDMLILLGAWGPCNGDCPADLNGDGVVNVSDLLILLGNWGTCPDSPGAFGACCFDDGTCMADTSEADCNTAGGNYNGDFTSCSSCPDGTTCSTALPASPGPNPIQINTTGNPVGDIAVCNGITPSSPTAWYAVTGTGNTMTVDACTQSGSGVVVFCGSCTTLPVCVASGSANNSTNGAVDCGNPFDGSASWCSEEGSVYFVGVWGSGSGGVDIDVYITEGGSCSGAVSCSPVGECAGNCGAQAPSGCWCDNGCAGFGDCCAFVCNACPGLTHCGGQPGTCEGNCGGNDPDPNADGCWCTADCGGFDDCCSDVCDFCPEECVLCDDVTCSPGSTPEGEPCGDDANNGCSADPPSELFGSVDFGETICGNLWADGGTRDLDWFLFTVTEPTEVSWTVEASESTVAFLASGNFPNCGTEAVIVAEAGCNVTVTACLEPGTYAALVGADGFEGFPCPGYTYEATLTGVPVAECDGGGGDPNSCAGNCGGQAPGGCWCDAKCCGFGDCCDDMLNGNECGGC